MQQRAVLFYSKVFDHQSHSIGVSEEGVLLDLLLDASLRSNSGSYMDNMFLIILWSSTDPKFDEIIDMHRIQAVALKRTVDTIL